MKTRGRATFPLLRRHGALPYGAGRCAAKASAGEMGVEEVSMPEAVSRFLLGFVFSALIVCQGVSWVISGGVEGGELPMRCQTLLDLSTVEFCQGCSVLNLGNSCSSERNKRPEKDQDCGWWCACGGGCIPDTLLRALLRALSKLFPSAFPFTWGTQRASYEMAFGIQPCSML